MYKILYKFGLIFFLSALNLQAAEVKGPAEVQYPAQFIFNDSGEAVTVFTYWKRLPSPEYCPSFSTDAKPFGNQLDIFKPAPGSKTISIKKGIDVSAEIPYSEFLLKDINWTMTPREKVFIIKSTKKKSSGLKLVSISKIDFDKMRERKAKGKAKGKEEEKKEEQKGPPGGLSFE